MKTALRRLSLVPAVLACVFFATVSVFSQSKNRTLQWAEIPLSNRNMAGAPGTEVLAQVEVLEVKEISVAGKSITIGEPFAADDNWLTNLTFRLKNISNQTFSSIQIDLILPEIMPGGPLVSLCYGCGGVGMGRSMMPGDEVEMKVVFQQWVTDQIKSKSNPSAITKAQIQHVSVKQPDGKKLFGGCIRTADQKNACPTTSQ
jgi:hypothetical protein